jgi:S-adenosylmethionine synthetase
LRRGSNRFVEASNADRRSDKSHISKGASTAHIRRRPSVARNIFVEELIHTPIEQQHDEIVERKGIGHPDSIADGLAEAVSCALCKMYKAKYGRILHHNTDQVEVVGGQSAPKFGGGVFLEPAYILLVGRATTMVNGERLPYRTAAIQAAHDYLEKTCTNLNVDADVILDCRIGQGSVDLRGLYDTQKALANDTSFGVGFAPFSELETLVLETEHLINGPMKRDLKEIGQDIKVMGVRQKDSMRLTIAAALVDRYVADKDHYRSAVDELRERVLDNAVKYTDREVKVDINTGDNYDTGIFYLTVTGLSWENGDDGSVGRGNRVSGLITPYRPMSMEAAAGKNPVTHVGKLYNLLSFEIADRLVKEHQGKVKEVWVRIVSQIGKPIDEPQAATAQIIPEEGTRVSSIQKDAVSLIDDELEKIYKMTDRIVEGKVHTF